MSSYERSVFINCPFDDEYKPLFDSIVFSIYDCGFIPRCAQEIDDSSLVRIEKILFLIKDSKYAVHDLSRVELNANSLPRFNMPLELGLFLGAKKFGSSKQKIKQCLILDEHRYRYQESISDISGQDIKAHNNDASQIIRSIRNWLNNQPDSGQIPGATKIIERYEQFLIDKPNLYSDFSLHEDDVTFADYLVIIEEWLKVNTL